MVQWGVVLGEIICQILFSLAPVDDELVLIYSVLYPVEYHFDCLRPLMRNGPVGNALCCLIFGTYRRWCLGVAHLNENCSHDCAVFFSDKEGCELGFCG